MADVTIVPPSGQVQTVTGTGQSPSGATTTQHLAQGSLITGTIAGKDGEGNYLLKSPQGTFAVRSSAALTYNSDVTIRIGANAAGNTSARIVSVNGEPFADFIAPEAEGTDSVSSGLLTQTAAPVATDNNSAAASGVRALVVAAPAPSTGQTEAGGITQGATVLLRANPAASQNIAANIPAANPATGQSAAAAESNPQPAAISTSAVAAIEPVQQTQNTQIQVSAASPPPPQANTNANTATLATSGAAAPQVETDLAPAQAVTQVAQVQVPADQTASSPPQPEAQNSSSEVITAPSPQPSAPAVNLYGVYTKQSSAPATTISPSQSTGASNTPTLSAASEPVPAQVISTEGNGTLNLSTPLGNVTVQTSVPSLSALPPGTALTLELVTAAAAEAGTTDISSGAPASLNELAASWQTLKDIAGATGSDDSAASSTLLARLPEMGPAFISQSTAFISSLLQGEARQLLGDDTVDTLKQNGRTDLLEKFDSEAATISDSFNMPAARQAPSWQAFFLPFVFQEVLQQARIYVKRDMPKKEKAQKQMADTRFVVEVDLSETGPLQLDGLVRKQEKAVAFDLVIRSGHAFSSEEQTEILAIYNNAAELTGFRGSLAFQVTRDFPVKPLEDISRAKTHGITI